MITVPQAFALALEHHQAGRLAEAEALYRQILAVQPRHAESLHLLGAMAHQLGRDDLAIEWTRQALAIEPNNPGAHSNLGEAYRVLGRLDEAIVEYHRALQLDPDFATGYNNLGIALAAQGNLGEAVTAFRRVLQLQPQDADACNNLGNALRGLHQTAEAVGAYRRALELRPDYGEAHHNLGTALNDLDSLVEAEAEFRTALRLKPQYPEAWNSLGVVLAGQGDLDGAVASYRHALEFHPHYPEASSNLAVALRDRGELDESIRAFRDALQFQPTHAGIHSNLIYALHFQPGQDDRRVIEEQERWNHRFGAPLRRSIAAHGNERNPERRLRIGYVSPDFRHHVVARNLLPLFQGHDRRGFEILCYSDAMRPDSLTEKIRQQADHWRDTCGVADEMLAETIRQDGVDILVDLTQHMAGNRLTMFARQPAPVQASFAGYPESTGVEAIEYRLSDRWLESESLLGRERSPSVPSPLLGNKEDGECSASLPYLNRAERVFLLDSFWCYDPCGVTVKVNSLPAMETGNVTFGSLNNFCKINDPLLILWARVLRALPESRLVMLSGKGSHRQRTVEFLEREGVEPRRVEFVEPRPHAAYFELYHRLDIVLDPFPYNGHTTSLDALWMGVPVVSLVGPRAVSRAGWSQLSNLGLPELVARSDDEYAEIATRLARDLPRLAELRCTLRARMEASVLRDAPRFARDIEAAYRAMWRRWCQDLPQAPPSS